MVMELSPSISSLGLFLAEDGFSKPCLESHLPISREGTCFWQWSLAVPPPPSPFSPPAPFQQSPLLVNTENWKAPPSPGGSRYISKGTFTEALQEEQKGQSGRFPSLSCRLQSLTKPRFPAENPAAAKGKNGLA